LPAYIIIRRLLNLQIDSRSLIFLFYFFYFFIFDSRSPLFLFCISFLLLWLFVPAMPRLNPPPGVEFATSFVCCCSATNTFIEFMIDRLLLFIIYYSYLLPTILLHLLSPLLLSALTPPLLLGSASAIFPFHSSATNDSIDLMIDWLLLFIIHICCRPFFCICCRPCCCLLWHRRCYLALLQLSFLSTTPPQTISSTSCLIDFYYLLFTFAADHSFASAAALLLSALRPPLLPITAPSVATPSISDALCCYSLHILCCCSLCCSWLHLLLVAIATADIWFYCSQYDLLFIFCILPLLPPSLRSHRSTCCYSLHLGCYLLPLGLAPLFHNNDRIQSKKPPWHPRRVSSRQIWGPLACLGFPSTIAIIFACVWTKPHVLPVTGPNHASVAVGGLLFRFVCDSVALPSALPSALPWLHPLLLAIATTDIRFYCSHSDLLFIFVFSLYSLPRCSHLSTCCYLLHLGYCCYFSASHPSPIRTTGRSQKQKPPWLSRRVSYRQIWGPLAILVFPSAILLSFRSPPFTRFNAVYHLPCLPAHFCFVPSAPAAAPHTTDIALHLLAPI
jgi:hypothetical protein